MQQALPPYATAGVTIVGAGLIAVTPAVAPLPDLLDVQSAAVQLTATGFEAWTDQFNAAVANATTLYNNFALAPFVGLQQAIVNQQDFANGLQDGTLTTNDVAQQMQAHLDAILTGFTLQNATTDTVNSVVQHTISATDAEAMPPTFGHDLLFLLLPALLPADQAATITPIVDFLASPLSGIIIGELGPFISPWVALINSIGAGDNFSDILANTVGAFFNGATLDLSGLIPLIEQSGLLPMPEGTLTHLDFAFGGLLSPGTVQPIYDLADGDGTVVDSVPAVGGSIFNSLGLGLNAAALGIPLQLTIDSEPVGPIGASLGWGQAVGALLGSGWDGKGHVTVTPPLFGLPLIPADMDDGGADPAAYVPVDLSSIDWSDPSSIDWSSFADILSSL